MILCETLELSLRKANRLNFQLSSGKNKTIDTLLSYLTANWDLTANLRTGDTIVCNEQNSEGVNGPPPSLPLP